MSSYTIVRGDTLGDIAARNKTTVEELAKANNISDPNKIYAGSTLKIPTAQTVPSVTTPPTTTPAPVVTTPPAVTTPTSDVSRFIKTPADNSGGVATAERDLSNFYSTGEAPQSLAQITETKRKAAQAAVDMITQQYNTLVSQDRQQGDANNARVRALNTSAGLSGSDFASAAAINTEEKNKKVIEARQAERDSKINSILAGVDDRASEEYRKQRENALANIKGNLDLQTKLVAEDRAKANESLKGLAGHGVTIEALKRESPDTYNTLLKEYGGSQVDLETAWNDALPDSKKVKYQDTIVEGPNGMAQILRYGVDPQTNTIDKKVYDLGTDYNKLKGIKPVVVNGTLYREDASGNYVPLTPIKSSISSSKGGVKSGNLSLTPDQLSKYEDGLNSSKGEDNYVDPTVYQQAFDAWTAGGGTTKGFLTQFPPNNYVNPENTWLPQYLRSTVKKGTNSTSTGGRQL